MPDADCCKRYTLSATYFSSALECIAPMVMDNRIRATFLYPERKYDCANKKYAKGQRMGWPKPRKFRLPQSSILSASAASAARCILPT